MRIVLLTPKLPEKPASTTVVIPNIVENKRNRKQVKRGRKRLF